MENDMIRDFAKQTFTTLSRRVRTAFDPIALPRDDHMRADIGLPPLSRPRWCPPPGLR